MPPVALFALQSVHLVVGPGVLCTMAYIVIFLSVLAFRVTRVGPSEWIVATQAVGALIVFAGIAGVELGGRR